MKKGAIWGFPDSIVSIGSRKKRTGNDIEIEIKRTKLSLQTRFISVRQVPSLETCHPKCYSQIKESNKEIFQKKTRTFISQTDCVARFYFEIMSCSWWIFFFRTDDVDDSYCRIVVNVWHRNSVSRTTIHISYLESWITH